MILLAESGLQKQVTPLGGGAGVIGVKRLFVQVRQYMDFQMGLFCRGIRAHSAHKGLLVRMRHGLQVSRICVIMTMENETIFFFSLCIVL